MSRSFKTIAFTAVVFRNDKGFLARALELPVISTPPAKTQRGAIKNLKIALMFWLTDMEVAGQLIAGLDEAGFRAYSGSSELEVSVYQTQRISMPLDFRIPKQDFTISKNQQHSGGKERHAQ